MGTVGPTRMFIAMQLEDRGHDLELLTGGRYNMQEYKDTTTQGGTEAEDG